MCAEKAAANGEVAQTRELARRLQLFALVLQRESIAGFDLERGDAFGEQGIQPRHRGLHQLGTSSLTSRLHRRGNASAAARDLLVGHSGEPALELACAIATVDEMSVAIDEAWRNPPAVAVDRFRRIETSGRIRGGAGKRDGPVATS